MPGPVCSRVGQLYIGVFVAFGLVGCATGRDSLQAASYGGGRPVVEAPAGATDEPGDILVSGDAAADPGVILLSSATGTGVLNEVRDTAPLQGLLDLGGDAILPAGSLTPVNLVASPTTALAALGNGALSTTLPNAAATGQALVGGVLATGEAAAAVPSTALPGALSSVTSPVLASVTTTAAVAPSIALGAPGQALQTVGGGANLLGATAATLGSSTPASAGSGLTGLASPVTGLVATATRTTRGGLPPILGR